MKLKREILNYVNVLSLTDFINCFSFASMLFLYSDCIISNSWFRHSVKDLALFLQTCPNICLLPQPPTTQGVMSMVGIDLICI